MCKLPAMHFGERESILRAKVGRADVQESYPRKKLARRPERKKAGHTPLEHRRM